MDEEAQKTYFRTKALEKRQAKKTQYQVDQVYAEDDDADPYVRGARGTVAA